MNKTFLTAASAIAIMAAAPAFADTSSAEYNGDDVKAKAEVSVEAEQPAGNLKEDAKEAWKNTKEGVSAAAKSVSDATKEVYKDAKHALKDNDESAEFEKISVDSRMTANGMIGQPVYNDAGERVAKIRDIILDSHGNAMMVVLADGDFTGLGKLVAYDYDIITKRSPEGDVIASLNEDMIDKAASFSYDRGDHSDEVRVVPNNGYSVSKLLDGELKGPEGETLAHVDNVIFRDGQAGQVVVSFDGTFGMGAKHAAIAYDDADLQPEGENVNLELSASEATIFKNFKEKAYN